MIAKIKVAILKKIRAYLYDFYRTAMDNEFNEIVTLQRKAIATGIQEALDKDCKLVLVMNNKMIDGVATVMLAKDQEEEKKENPFSIVPDES